MEVRERIARVRVQKDLSRTELADKLGISRRQLWRIEKGKINLLANDVPRFARALGCSIVSLFGGRA